ncbi:MAG TPA: TonB-dependent receptor, partial [Tenuifilaceae bacterium]|nr:TonB-dependent receptor [Tenuifilaceae bacterium]
MKHAVLFLLGFPLPALAQPDSTSMKVNLDTVWVFSPQRVSSYSELSRMVGVVKRSELRQMKATSLSEVLERSTSIDIRQRGTHGVQADINFRGGSFDQTLVMLNDINISDPQTGHHNLNIPIVLDAVSRIEILQGPGARELGQGAFSGAINIITGPSAKNEFSLSTFAGEYGLLKTSASATFGSAKIRTFTAASFERSNGYTDNTDFTGENFFFHTHFYTGAGNFSLFSGYQDKGFGANSFYTPKYPNQFEATRTLLSGLKYSQAFGRTSISARGYYRKNFDRFELFRENPPSWYMGHNYHTTDVYGLKANISMLYGFGKTEVGAEIRREEILSSNLGEALSDSVRVKGRNAWYTKGGNRNLLNIFASQTFYLKRATLSGGLQLAYNSSFEYIWCWGADISYSLNNHSRFFASVNRSYRVPTFTDLYYSSPTNVGNPNLKPEFATTIEGGLKANRKAWSVQLAAFYRQGSRIVDWVKEPTDEAWHTINHTSLNTTGV